MKYAGVSNGYVIIVKETNVRPHFPNTNDGDEVITVECDDTVQVGDEYVDGEIIGTKTEEEQTQLDRIEKAVNDIAVNGTSWNEMAQAIAEGVNEI